MKAPHLISGLFSERRAGRWLQQQGLRPVASNYRCPCGELDLIMLDGECLVIVEVRYRRKNSFGGALASVTRGKQARICRSTQHYLQHHPQHQQRPVRFDVLAMSGNNADPNIDWRRCAFDASMD